ncbi:MAG TPA: hypothetical protein VFH51_18895, partial [Myxococcota bacterium]|nr:hypothetical protein [Myxococcota bacterium]
QKSVHHTPAAKLLTLFLGLLCGNEYLTDLTTNPAPLYRDPQVAAAWGVPALAEASGVSRTLAAADETTLRTLQTTLDAIAQPFLDRAVADLRTRNRPLVLDADLTGRPVSSSSQTYPHAAFGYMDGQIRLGYQIAEICVQTDLYGRQWLAAHQHPGDTVSAPCLVALIQAAEARLACHPRRRTDLLDGRIAAVGQKQALWDQCLAAATAAVQQALEREEQTLAQITTAQTALRTSPPHTRVLLSRQIRAGERRLGFIRRRWARATRRVEHAQGELAQVQVLLATLQTHRASLAAENAAQPDAPRCIVRMDAGFSSGENLTLLLELGYEIVTKSANAALLATLVARITPTTAWVRVGQNAEMIAWTQYQLRTCPYPLTVGLERFHTPQGLQHAVLLRSHPSPNLRAWFGEYNARQTVEAGIKQSKTVFHVQHPMSRSHIGMQIQVAFTLFAANFVHWAHTWVQEHLVAAQARVARPFARLKALVRVAANSPASVETHAGQTLVR